MCKEDPRVVETREPRDRTLDGINAEALFAERRIAAIADVYIRLDNIF